MLATASRPDELWALEVPVEDDGWDPSNPNALDPVEDAAWHRPPLVEMAHLDRASARIYGGQLVEVLELTTTRVREAEAEALAQCAKWGIDGSKAREHRDRAVEFARRSVGQEVALSLEISPDKGEGWVQTAEQFATRLPATLTALLAGTITRRKAEILLDQTAGLSLALCARVEAQALAAAAGRNDEQFRDRVRRFVEKADADAVRRRHEKARETRRVGLWPVADGMWELSAILPPEDAFAAYGILDAYAQAAKQNQAPGDSRGIDALRADALMDLLLGTGEQSRVSYRMQIVVPVGTMLGVGDEPGHLPGRGPIPADVCRRLAGDATWQRLLTDPDTGNLLDLAPNTYKPGRRLDAFVRTRDQTCRWPGCRRRAHRTDLDHTVEFRVGGRTVRINMACLCRKHHGLKHLSGWTCVQDPDGTLTFTTPTGAVYRARPPTMDGETPAVETVETVAKDEDVPPF